MDYRDKPGIVQALGISRTDIFFDPHFLEQAQKHVHDLIPETKTKKILLYAPHFAEISVAQQLRMLGILYLCKKNYVTTMFY